MKKGRAILEADFGRVLLPLARRWRAAADRAVAGLGLSHASGWVLLHVGRLGDTVRQSDLAATLDIQGPSLVRLIDRLESDGLVGRQPEAGDRRINRIRLTPPGHALVGRIEDALEILRHDMLGGIDDADLVTATLVLQRLDARMLDRRERPL
jgi:MarR family transcriptional regulator for hemolysin